MTSDQYSAVRIKALFMASNNVQESAEPPLEQVAGTSEQSTGSRGSDSARTFDSISNTVTEYPTKPDQKSVAPGPNSCVVHPTVKLLGIHAIGESATEIIHIGQTAMALDGTIEFFRDSVFNYPTFAEAYKVAALNGLNKL